MQKQQNNYLSSVYLKAVDQFQTFAQEATHIEFHYEKIPIIKMQQVSHIHYKRMSKLQEGLNYDSAIQLTTLRIMDMKKISLLLAFEKQPLINRFIYVVVMLPESENLQLQWNRKININMKILIHHPYNISVKEQMRYLIVILENIKVVEEHLRHKDNWQTIKSTANNLYRNRKFDEAFITYENALCNIFQYSQKKERAILYSNSSACLYEMRLYEASVAYANIAIKLDPSYPKSYARKINGLLQLRKFSEIPICMSKLQVKISPKQLEIINVKYLTYLGNDIGLYNWAHIYNLKNPQFGEYYSEKIRKQNRYYKANSKIQAYELVLVNKPLIYMRIGGEFRKHFPKVMEEVYRYSCLQRSFYEDIKSLPCICHPEGTNDQSQSLENQKDNFNQDQLIKKIDRCVTIERMLQKISYQIGYGIWKHMFSLQQHCRPNCSYVHLKSALVIFTNRVIYKDQILTIDCFSDLDLQARVKIVKVKLGCQCKCQYCKNFSLLQIKQGNTDYENLKILQGCQHIWMRKGILWWILTHSNKSKSKAEQGESIACTLYRYIGYVEQESNWEDLLNLLRYMRDIPEPQLRYKLKMTVKKLFQKYLKISEKESLGLLKKIQE